MKYNQYEIRNNVWLYPGMAGWHFVSIPQDISEDIKNNFGNRKRGWGSLPVIVTIGKTSWRTSIFPDKKVGGYLLPLKAEVRKKEGIVAEDTVSLLLEIRI
ncbi:MAG: DUF1905 domain-containing protein [Candidatus Levybacteria bacterium]|nr:DUF1905 domain-containing protein [Candidatus Levybacteria bacterium]